MIGIALGVGGASVKFVLFMKSYRNNEFTPTYAMVAGPIAPLIPLGLVLLTVSGIGFFLIGYPEGSSLLVKHILVVALWIVGILIDKVYEPKYLTLAPKAGGTPTPEFLQIRKRLMPLETVGTILFYAIVIIGVIM